MKECSEFYSIESLIIGTLSRKGQLTRHQLQQSIQEIYGRTIPLSTISDHLDDLKNIGWIKRQPEERHRRGAPKVFWRMACS